jgi:hypothetical protein
MVLGTRRYLKFSLPAEKKSRRPDRHTSSGGLRGLQMFVIRRQVRAAHLTPLQQRTRRARTVEARKNVCLPDFELRDCGLRIQGLPLSCLTRSFSSAVISIKQPTPPNHQSPPNKNLRNMRLRFPQAGAYWGLQYLTQPLSGINRVESLAVESSRWAVCPVVPSS